MTPGVNNGQGQQAFGQNSQHGHKASGGQYPSYLLKEQINAAPEAHQPEFSFKYLQHIQPLSIQTIRLKFSQVFVNLASLARFEANNKYLLYYNRQAKI